MSSNAEKILGELKQSESPRVKVAITDIDGVLRGKYLNGQKFQSALNSGFGFCNVVFGWDSADVCYDNGAFTGWHTGYPDALVRIDSQTARRVPWDGNVPFFLGDFEGLSGQPLSVCPRQLLKRVLTKIEKAGFQSFCGMEFEWFNFKETPQTLADKKFASVDPITPGMFGYSVLRASLNQPFFAAMMEELNSFGVPLEGLHTETGPGVFEAALLYSQALEAADRAVLFKTSVKEIGYRFGIVPSFMAKWNVQLPGCSGHLHQSLWDSSGNKNLFYDEKDPFRMSGIFKSYAAGILKLLPEVLPFFAPTINSYKRLVDGYWAPTRVSWGVDNRTTAIRVIPGSSNSTRLELRVPGADVNPYLAIAASVACGYYGVEKGLKLDDPPITGSAYHSEKAERLPRNLYEATLRLSESKTARELFGDDFVEHFVQTRIWEWRRFQDAVTDWELQRYFEII